MAVKKEKSLHDAVDLSQVPFLRAHWESWYTDTYAYGSIFTDLVNHPDDHFPYTNI